MNEHLPQEQKKRPAREEFMRRSGKKTKVIGDWTQLAKYDIITEDENYSLCEELKDIMGRVWESGRAWGQVQCRKSVDAWTQDRSEGASEIEVPIHLRSIKGNDDPTILQDLYVTMQMAYWKCQLDGSAWMLARWGLVRLVDKYHATIRAVKSAVGYGKIKLGAGQTTLAEAKLYIPRTIYTTDAPIGEK
ncbi:MAG: hypothetical protein Q9173_005410 [Seirophora scorigena]